MDLTEAEETLGVTRDASKSQIKAAFRKQAQEHHPDKSGAPDAVKKFQQLEQAKRRLIDEQSDTATQQSRCRHTRDNASTRQSTSTSTNRSSTAGSERTHHRTRGQTDHTERGRPKDEGSQRIYSKVWTGLSFWELVIHIRHHSIPYLSTFQHRTKQGGPALLSVLVGFFGLILFEQVVSGLAVVGLTLATQYLVTRKYIDASSMHRDNQRPNYFDNTYGFRIFSRAVVPLVGCAGSLYLLSTVFGASLGGVVPSIVVLLVWVAMVGVLTAIAWLALAVVWEPKPTGSVAAAAGLLTLVFGFTNWIGPVLFGTINGAYLIDGAYTVAGVDVVLLGNIVLSGLLLYSTVGFFFNTSARFKHVVYMDYLNRSTVSFPLWVSAPGMVVTVLFGLGGAVTDSIALLGAAAIAAPAIVLLLYLLRRQIEPWRHSEEESGDKQHSQSST